MDTALNNLSPEAIIGIFRDAFTTFDTDDDGYLNFREIADLLIALEVPVNDEELKEMTEEVDIEGNGTIDFKEFILLMQRKMRDLSNEEEYIEAFRIFDKNRDDVIGKDELKEVMSVIGEHVWGEKPSDEDIEQMIKEADRDYDGYLNYSEFLKKITETN